ncbi:hypothetical protein OAA67_00045 [Winogradskyella sp.]|nr:hypothetical protein [Winogradskyella sp.]
MADIENFGINRVVHDYEDDNENYYQVITYVLAYLEDGAFQENVEELFEFLITKKDSLLVENEEDLELDFIDIYEEELYRFDELETLLANDVKAYGESLNIEFNINKIKKRCVNHLTNS